MQLLNDTCVGETETGIVCMTKTQIVQIDFPIAGNPRYLVIPDRAQSWSFSTFAGAMDYAERVLAHHPY